MSKWQNGVLYFWLNDVELAIERVAARVKEGGHFIAEDVIRRRYQKGIINFNVLFRQIVDFWVVINNTEMPPNVIAKGVSGKEAVIYAPLSWIKFLNK